ncbi:MAG: DUF1501 domain-containing protein, partial [Thermoanaerobaculia bacterium]|nr:DUF1501 domain-containing protein [Thermoanaerobaculia bacterium]
MKKNTTDVTRRGFLVGCSAAIAGLAGSRFNSMAFAHPGGDHDVLVTIFLRGGMDGLSLICPIDGADRGHYEAARPGLAIPTSGPGSALPLSSAFGLHPAAAPLLGLWQDSHMAVIQASGMIDVVNKSHFDAMQFVELGTPGSISAPDGWLTRHLQTTSGLPPEVVLPSLAIGDLQPVSLLDSLETVNVADPDRFEIGNGPWQWRDAQRTALRNIYDGQSSWLHDAGLQALDAIDIIQLNATGEYTPSGGAVYPEDPFGEQLRLLAQMIKLDLGLQVATIDFGGWDTHEGQGSGSQGYLAELFGSLATGLEAFYTDLDADLYTNRLTVVVQSEFGRELHENADSGTEHGYGNRMLVLGGNVNGGFHGTFPGLHPDVLVDGTDLGVTTDYRQVLSEILIRRLHNPAIDVVFPGYTGYS